MRKKKKKMKEKEKIKGGVRGTYKYIIKLTNFQNHSVIVCNPSGLRSSRFPEEETIEKKKT